MLLPSMTRKWLMAVLPILLIVLAGCQSIGGVDIGKALLNQVTVDSMQGKMELSFNLTTTEDADQWMEPSELEMFKVFNEMKIILDDFKQESMQIFSMNGKISLGKGDIPFQASMNATDLTIQLEGASVPIVIPLNMEELSSGDALGLSGFGSLTSDPELFQNEQLLQTLSSFFLKHMPNPQSIKLDSVTDTVNGESLSLYKLHTEIKGSEMLTLFKQLLRGILKDDAGLKEVIALMYDLFETAEGENPLAEAGSLFGVDTMMEDRELAIEVMHATVKQMLVFFIAFSEEEDDYGMGLNELFTDDTSATADLYIDSSLHIRKSNLDLTFAAPASMDAETSGLASIQLKMSGEYWNHNKAVKADIIDTTDKEVYSFDLSSASDPGEDFIAILEPDSVLYTWLKDDLHLTRKTVVFDVSEYDFSPEDQKAQYMDGIIHVPSRYFADSLGLELEWNNETNEVTFIDSTSGSTLKIVDGSSTAELNGESIEMGSSPYRFEGRIYIPLRFVSDSLGATIEWDPIWETATVTKE